MFNKIIVFIFFIFITHFGYGQTCALITEPDVFTVICSKTDVSTAGGNNGTASVVASGGTSPYTYLWSNGGTNASISSLTAATYMVTVTDANNCASVVCSSTVSQPNCTVVTTNSTTQPTCANNDGSINLTVTGATGTPTYIWSNGATTEDISALPAGDYTVAVTDGACTINTTITLNKPNANIPYTICPSDSYKLEIQDNTLTGIQWLKNGVVISGANALTYTATEVGIYTYTSNGVGGCAVGQCCPIEITLSTNCCKPQICTSVKITKN